MDSFPVATQRLRRVTTRVAAVAVRRRDTPPQPRALAALPAHAPDRLGAVLFQPLAGCAGGQVSCGNPTAWVSLCLPRPSPDRIASTAASVNGAAAGPAGPAGPAGMTDVSASDITLDGPSLADSAPAASASASRAAVASSADRAPAASASASRSALASSADRGSERHSGWRPPGARPGPKPARAPQARRHPLLRLPRSPFSTRSPGTAAFCLCMCLSRWRWPGVVQ